MTFGQALKLSFLLLLGAIVGAANAQPDSLRWNEFKPTLMTDFGHVVRGDYGGRELKFQPLNRNTVLLEQSGVYESWTFDAGFKAIMWWPFPPTNAPESRTIRVEPRLSRVSARYDFVSSGSNRMGVEFGFFPYKYNPDAQNLGEYLYRSGTYPGVVRTTDGFNLMNYALYEAYGAHFQVSQFEGMITHDFNLFAEPTTRPIGDITPAYEFGFNLPLIQIGAGAAYNRLLAYHPSRNRPHADENGYYVVDSVNGGGVEFEGPFGLLDQNNPIRNRISADDSTVRSAYYYEQRGLKLMVRAAVDLGAIFIPEEMRNPGDLRIFVEAALLGWENQPYFYEKRSERIPVMFGMNIPTFKMLDLLSVQGEYYRSPFYSSTDYDYYAYPTWNLTLDEDPVGSGDYVYRPNHRDDWKWSVHAAKNINRLLTVRAQVANDHMRLPAFNLNPTGSDLTSSPTNWYYLLRLECRL